MASPAYLPPDRPFPNSHHMQMTVQTAIKSDTIAVLLTLRLCKIIGPAQAALNATNATWSFVQYGGTVHAFTEPTMEIVDTNVPQARVSGQYRHFEVRAFKLTCFCILYNALFLLSSLFWVMHHLHQVLSKFIQYQAS